MDDPYDSARRAYEQSIPRATPVQERDQLRIKGARTALSQWARSMGSQVIDSSLKHRIERGYSVSNKAGDWNVPDTVVFTFRCEGLRNIPFESDYDGLHLRVFVEGNRISNRPIKTFEDLGWVISNLEWAEERRNRTLWRKFVDCLKTL